MGHPRTSEQERKACPLWTTPWRSLSPGTSSQHPPRLVNISQEKFSLGLQGHLRTYLQLSTSASVFSLGLLS